MGIKSIEQSTFDSHMDYDEMGAKVVDAYTYHGYKQYRGTSWKIKREHTASKVCDWVYGDTGWTTAWTTPAGLSYAAPPDN